MPKSKEIRTITKKRKAISDIIVNLFKDENMTRTTYAELRLLPFLEKLLLSTDGKVVSEKIPFRGRGIYFRVTMEKGGVLEIHDHDCKEWVYCSKGVVYDKKSKITLQAMQKTFFSAQIPHILEAKEDAVLYVEFEEPKL